MTQPSLDALTVTPKTGDDRFTHQGHDVGANLLSFWRWACSDLVGNVMRGVLAEYIVGSSGWRWDVSTVAYVLSGTPPTFAPPRTVGWR